KIVAPTLISCGLIIPELHFGLFSCNWWLEIITENGQESFPIHIGMSIVTELNGRNFTVCAFKNSKGQPGYICESGEYIGEEKDHINNLLILEKLLDDVLFRPFSVMVEKYKIFIYGLGVSDSESWHGAGTGYMSSFISDYKRKRCLFFQSIKNKLCCIEIYDDREIISHAIKRFVSLGNDVETGEDIEKAIRNKIQGTSVAHIEPKRNVGKIVDTIVGVSNWYSWKWPIDEES
ncbi:6193_t:CDS:2, partial [Entrophospora sp. SA101]